MTVVSAASIARAEPIAWTGAAGNGSWDTPGNWDLLRLPNAADDVTIALPGTYTVVVSSPTQARTISLGGAPGTQSIHISGPGQLQAVETITVLPSGVVNTDSSGGWPYIRLNGAPGTLINQGAINCSVSPGAALRLWGNLNNQGSFTVHSGAVEFGTPNAAQWLSNTGVLSLAGGDMQTSFGVNLSATNSGTLSVSPGRTYRQVVGQLNLSAGTTDAPSGHLDLVNVALTVPPDFHTSDVGTISINGGRVYGAGSYINDDPEGTVIVANTGVKPEFYLPVVNRSLLTCYGALFLAGFENQAEGHLIVRSAWNHVVHCHTSLINHGVIDVIGQGAEIKCIGPLPEGAMYSLINRSGGEVHIRREPPEQGPRYLRCAIDNAGLIKLHEVSLVVGEGNYNLGIENRGTFDMSEGNLLFHTAPFNRATIFNYGLWEMGDTARQISPGLTGGFWNYPGGVLSGSGEIRGRDPTPTSNPTLVNIAGTVRPGGLESVGTLEVWGHFRQGPLGRLEIDIAGPTPGVGHDYLLVHGDAEREGVLTAGYIDCAEPAPGTQFPVMLHFSGPIPGTSFVFESNALGVHHSLTGVTLTAGGCTLPVCPVVVTSSTPQSALDALVQPEGGVVMEIVCQRTLLSLPNMTSTAGLLTVTGNPDLSTVSAPVLGAVGGDFDISNNPSLAGVSAGVLGTVGGDFVITANNAATGIAVGALGTVGGDFDISGNTSLAGISAGVLATVGGDVRLRFNPLLQSINLPALTSTNGELVIEGNTSAGTIQLGSLGSTGGGIEVLGNTSAGTIDFGSLSSTGGDIVVLGNTSAGAIQFGSLGTVGGDLDISDNPAATVLDLGSVLSISGSLSLRNNDSLPSASLPSLGTVGGDLTVSGNQGLGGLGLGSVTEIGGDLEVTANPSLGGLGLPSLDTIMGDLVVSDNSGLATIGLSGLAEIGGDVVISDNQGLGGLGLGSVTVIGGDVEVTANPSLGGLGLPSLDTIMGDVVISGNPGLATIDVGAVTTIGGSLTVSDNPGLATIDVGAVTAIGGSLTVSDNPSADTLILGSLQVVANDATIETQSNPVVDLLGVLIGGSLDLDAADATAISVSLPAATTSIGVCHAEECFDALIPGGAAPQGTAFSIARADPDTLDPVAGRDDQGEPARFDPLASYGFTLAAPSLAQPAALTFEIELAPLTISERESVIDAVQQGRFTVAVRGDGPSAIPQARPVCAPAGAPQPDGCVAVTPLTAAGAPASPADPASWSSIRLEAVVTHFSTYSVGTLLCAADFNAENGVTVQDIYDFLFAWNSGAASADFNNADGVTVQDIYDFLFAWNAGCP